MKLKNLSIDIEHRGELSLASIGAFLLTSYVANKTPIDSWVFDCEGSIANAMYHCQRNMASTRGDIMRKAIESLFNSSSEIHLHSLKTKALAAVADTDVESFLEKIKDWGFDERAVRGLASGGNCLFTASALSIKATGQKNLEGLQIGNQEFGDSVIQMDCSQELELQTNKFNDIVLSYKFPTASGGFIGFRWTKLENMSP